MRWRWILMLFAVDFLCLLSREELEDAPIIGSIIVWIGFGRKDPETSMSMEEIIRHHGYQVMSYDVITKDGYILTIQNILNERLKPCDSCRKPVILQHGFLADATSWIINTPDKNLAYILIDEGYDVWLSNSRGTNFGRKHISMDPDKHSEFWNFNWDQFAEFDVPAVIDFILKKTGHNKLLYVGHSMGTTAALALLSSKPEYNAKIKAFFALAPVYTRTHITSPIKYLAEYSSWLRSFEEGEFLPNNSYLSKLASLVCGLALFRTVCSTAFFLLYGFNFAQFNQTRLPVYVKFVPAGTSIQNGIHILQLVQSGKFHYFDYGPTENLKKYNKTVPPEYDVTKISAPVAIFWSDNDKMTHPKDVASLAEKLPNLTLNHRVNHTDFTHLDFLWAVDVKLLLYDQLVAIMKELATD